ncbi:hypothetical protein Hanom_Chr12g01170581 [Helianthus anomalus]
MRSKRLSYNSSLNKEYAPYGLSFCYSDSPLTFTQGTIRVTK